MAFAADRYREMKYNRLGRSGLLLPAISLGCWHNFGGDSVTDNMRALLKTAFDLGITHFDLANNYGPPPGSAETHVGRILASDFAGYRDEIVISTKAGYHMWEGPYGEWGSRKNLLASLDQSLKRMGLDYVDIFYSHRFDPNTPLEETIGALDTAVRQGKALYAGISNYDGAATVEASRIARDLGTPIIIHQANYSMFNRGIEKDLWKHSGRVGVGIIAFCPLAKGLLTNRYFKGIPADSRVATGSVFLKAEAVTAEAVEKARKLDGIAQARGQSLAQMALAWVLRDSRVTSALIGASKPEQIVENVGALKKLSFSGEELAGIDAIVAG